MRLILIVIIIVAAMPGAYAADSLSVDVTDIAAVEGTDDVEQSVLAEESIDVDGEPAEKSQAQEYEDSEDIEDSEDNQTEGENEVETAESRGSTSDIQVTTKYRIDARVMGETGSSPQADVMSAEAEVYASFGTKVDAAVQIPVATAMEGRGKDMHFGNAYAIIKGRVGAPTLKAGQFVIPFGNLPDYETHTTILQTLYPYSLGIRIDQGLQVDGFLDADTEYSIAATTGNGPYRSDIDGNKVLTARIARKMEIGNDDLRIGVSALKGRLPVFSLMTDPLMDGKDAMLIDVDTGHMVGQNDPHGFADKTRYAVDIEYYRGINLIRAELVRGSDNGNSVNGYWLQVERPLSYKTSLVGLVGKWNQTHGDWSNVAIGAEHKLNDSRILRLALERRRASEMGMTMNMNMLTFQYLMEF